MEPQERENVTSVIAGQAIRYALDMIKKGDILLVAGKGGEDYQEIMGIKYPFNDHDILKKLLEKKGK